MCRFRREFQEKFHWVLVHQMSCALHNSNTTVGKICGYPEIKKVISNNARVVSFFSRSHYWGGQLNEVAKKAGITRSLQTHSDTRWYTLIKQAMSVKEYHYALNQICLRDDAQKKTNGFSPVNADVVRIVCWEKDQWDLNEQLIRYAKPLVDMIGNLESRDASLADVMIELLKCARTLQKMPTYDTDNLHFLQHTRTEFDKGFHLMNTDLAFFALFLHPLCRKLALKQKRNSRTMR
ncbi:hypothetical protein EUX98_g9191 [Antrodiella citrinella]|uniref:Uncharacterized protein n=1 Tax=Antrodiella citrinella TaxID=2447956 RepID=A0A4S4LWX9_9APHY|nr:hypothetical protein EUX98_g9191 [Antrodiella citrinella]